MLGAPSSKQRPDRLINRRGIDVLCVTSTGGHLLQMHLLRPAWEHLDCVWVTHDTDDARSLLATEQVFFAYGPTTRNVINLLRNLGLALRVVSTLRPRVLVTAGAGVAVPFAWVAKLRGAKVVYIESLTRIDQPSLSCRLIAPIAARVYVQWPQLANAVGNSRFVGNVVSAR